VISSLAIFCGSADGNDPAYRSSAGDTAAFLAGNGIDLVYGGAKVGLMGAVADAALAAGGRVIGVIPQALMDREVAHPGLTELHVVASIHERKAVMSELSDGFLALPGGGGTLEEISEQWTWAQLGTHNKPCGFLNVLGFYTPLRQFIASMGTEGFLRPEYRDMLVFADTVEEALERFNSYAPPHHTWRRENPPAS
jgi:uncharacterized protein (TIGR00730 family)